MPNEHYAKQGYLLEDFRLFHLNSQAGVRTEYHYHEFCKLLLLVSGTGSYWIEGRQYALQPGDIVLVGNDTVHRPEFEPGRPYERIIIYISPEFLRRASTQDCDLLSCFSGEKTHVLRPEKGGAQLLTIARELERELSGADYGRLVLSNGLLLRLLVQIGRELRREDLPKTGPAKPQDPRVQAVMAYIDEHLTEDLSVEQIAEHCFMSKYHMMRLFRGDTGSSVYGYIIQRRLQLARELIGQGLSATESCFRCGFGSYSSFTRTYGKYFGTTPTGRKYSANLQDESYE